MSYRVVVTMGSPTGADVQMVATIHGTDDPAEAARAALDSYRDNPGLLNHWVTGWVAVYDDVPPVATFQFDDAT